MVHYGDMGMRDASRQTTKTALNRAVLVQILCHLAGLRPSSISLASGCAARNAEMLNNQLEHVSDEGFKKAVGGLAVGAVKFQIVEQPVRHIGGTLTIKFMKGETNADPTFEMNVNLPFELEQELTAGNRLFVSFALRELFVLLWRDALAKNDMRTKPEAAEWPIIFQRAADGSFLPSKHAAANALNNGMKELARFAALDDRYISLKSNRKGLAQAARSAVGMQETQRLLNHRPGSNATARQAVISATAEDYKEFLDNDAKLQGLLNADRAGKSTIGHYNSVLDFGPPALELLKKHAVMKPPLINKRHAYASGWINCKVPQGFHDAQGRPIQELYLRYIKRVADMGAKTKGKKVPTEVEAQHLIADLSRQSVAGPSSSGKASVAPRLARVCLSNTKTPPRQGSPPGAATID
ncbi:hypothetical protein HDU90_005200 [Geranomyces variabilis]|nr:hypothetical protein HDU90_005200 [Geranomyces variabilis]